MLWCFPASATSVLNGNAVSLKKQRDFQFATVGKRLKDDNSSSMDVSIEKTYLFYLVPGQETGCCWRSWKSPVMLSQSLLSVIFLKFQKSILFSWALNIFFSMCFDGTVKNERCMIQTNIKLWWMATIESKYALHLFHYIFISHASMVYFTCACVSDAKTSYQIIDKTSCTHFERYFSKEDKTGILQRLLVWVV